MTMDDIIASLNVVKYYNPSMSSLYDTFIIETPSIELNRDAVYAADEADKAIYETLVLLDVGLANAIHDYTYNIVHPFDAVIVKNTCREQMCRDLFGLSADF